MRERKIGTCWIITADGWVNQPAYYEAGGLAVTGVAGVSLNITHTSTGMAVAHNVTRSVRSARRTVQRLLALGDWRRGPEEFMADESFGRAARIVIDARNNSFTPGSFGGSNGPMMFICCSTAMWSAGQVHDSVCEPRCRNERARAYAKENWGNQ